MSSVRSSGGRGSSSNWCTESAPCRFEVPETVRPRVAAAENDDALAVRPSAGSAPSRRPPPCSAAVGTPSRSECRRARGPESADRAAAWRRRRGRSRRTRTAARRSARSKPTLALVTNVDPLGLHLLHAPVDQMLLHLEVGNAVAQQPADAVGPLEDGHRDDPRAPAVARTPGPLARSRRRRHACRCGAAGGCGVTQPSANA